MSSKHLSNIPKEERAAYKEGEEKLVESLRKLLGLSETTLVGRVTIFEKHRGFGYIRPVGRAPQLLGQNGKKLKHIYVHITDLGPEVPEGRLYMNQIVTYLVDVNSERGPRAVEVKVIHDPRKEQRLKRE